MNDIIYNSGTNRSFALTDAIIEMMKSAEKWIKACNLFFDDPRIKEALIAAASRGVAIFVLTNLEGTMSGVETNRKTGKTKKKIQSTQSFAHAAALTTLYDHGAHISGLDGLHAKFLLVDGGMGIVTSVNFTPNSTQKISEIGVRINGAEFDELEEIFDHIFVRPDKYHFSNFETHFKYERPKQAIDTDKLPRKSGVRMTLGATERGTGYALHNAKCFDLRDEIFSIIGDAQSGDNLYIATYSLDGTATSREGVTLYKTLLDAKKRNVKLNIVQRDINPAYLKEIYINYHKDNHAKLVLTSTRGILFTGNLTNESFTQGFDLGVILSESQIKQATKFVKQLIMEVKNGTDKI